MIFETEKRGGCSTGMRLAREKEKKKIVKYCRWWWGRNKKRRRRGGGGASGNSRRGISLNGRDETEKKVAADKNTTATLPVPL